MRRLVNGIILLTAVALVGGFLFYRAQQKAALDNAERDLTSISSLKLSSIVKWHHDLLDDAEQAAEKPVLKGLIASAGDSLAVTESNTTDTVFAAFLNHQDYECVRLVDDRGQTLYSFPAPRGALNDTERSTLEQALSTGKPVLSPFYRQAQTGAPHLCVAAPVYGLVRGNPMATHAVLLGVDPRSFLYPQIKRWPVSSRSAETVLVQREDQAVRILNDLRFQTNSAMRIRIALTNAGVSYVMAASGKSGIARALDYRGVPVLSVLTPVPDTDWYMSTEEDIADVLDDWHKRGFLILALLAALLAGGILTSVLAWQWAGRENLCRLNEAHRIAQIGSWEFDRSRNRLWWSDALYHMYEMDPRHAGVLTPDSFLSRLHPDDRAGVIDAIENNPSHRFACRMLFPDGRVKHLEGHGVTRMAEDGLKTRSFGTVQDVTARVHSEKALFESEHRYRMLAENATDVIWLLNLATQRFDYVSPAVLKMLGYTPEEALQLSLPEWMPPGEYEKIQRRLPLRLAAFAAGDESERHTTQELIQTCKDGRSVFTEMSTLLMTDQQGRVTHIQGLSRDLTERKRGETQKRQLEVLAEHTRDIILQVRADTGRIVEANPSALKTYGYNREELLSMTIYDLRATAPRQEVSSQMIAAARDGILFESVHRRKDGSLFPVEVSSQGTESEGQMLLISIIRDITERKRAELEIHQAKNQLEQANRLLEERVQQRTLELERSESKLRALFAAMPDVVLVLDKEGRYLEIAPTQPELLYRPATDLIGKTVHDVLPEDQAAFILNHVRSTLATSQNETVEYGMEIGGKPLHFSAIVAALDTDRVLFVARDNTLRKIAEESLRINEERFRALFNGSGDAIFVHQLTDDDTASRFSEVNDSACAWLGYSREELLTMTPRDINPREVDAKLASVNQSLRFSGKTIFETELISRAGRRIPVEVSSQLLTLGGALFSLDVMRDVTERKRVEGEVLRLSQVVEQSPTPVIMTDTDARVLYVNPAFQHVTGYSEADILGKNPSLLSSGLHPEPFYQQMWATLKAGGVWHGEFCNKRKSGELYWESAAIAPVRNSRGEVAYYVGIKQDITRTKQIERDLREAKSAADNANRAKGAFLANMSHEIRTPLNAILGYAQLLCRDPTIPAEAREKLNTINRSGDHLLGLINDVLELAKIEAGHITIEANPFDLFALLDDIAAMFRLRTQAKGLDLRLVRNPALPRFGVADEGRLRQILVNLCGNAVKFTEHGHIELRGSSGADPAGQPLLILEIEDTGIGIAAADAARLFRHFEQSLGGLKQRTGTGLGLAISRQYARLMGGDITVTSQEGRGSVFRVEIPIRVADEAHVAKLNAVRHVISLTPGQAPARVLVVDDMTSNRDWLVALLKQVHFEVREAGGGAEAIRLWAEWKPQLILMDLRMPDMDGYETTRKIKARPGGQETVILALTAAAPGEDYQNARAAGAADVIGKPFDVDTLFDKIASLLGLRFRYEEEANPSARPADPPFDPGRMKTLPPPLLAGLRSAVANGDRSRIASLLEELAGHDKDAAAFLITLAGQYDYDRLTGLLNKESDT